MINQDPWVLIFSRKSALGNVRNLPGNHFQDCLFLLQDANGFKIPARGACHNMAMFVNGGFSTRISQVTRVYLNELSFMPLAIWRTRDTTSAGSHAKLQ